MSQQTSPPAPSPWGEGEKQVVTSPPAPLHSGYALPTSFRLSRLRQPHPQPLSILERGGCGAISGPVKDWTTRQKTKIWTRTEGETGRTIGQNVGQSNLITQPRLRKARGGEGRTTGTPHCMTVLFQHRSGERQAGERPVERSDAKRQGSNAPCGVTGTLVTGGNSAIPLKMWVMHSHLGEGLRVGAASEQIDHPANTP